RRNGHTCRPGDLRPAADARRPLLARSGELAMTDVISIQSQVVHGHVGNSAAVFPMQAKGITVAAVPTALLSNHPHYPTMHGRTLDSELIEALLRGVEERGLLESARVVLTGYLGTVENGGVIASFLER